MYLNKDDKYGGKMYDILNVKLYAFYNYYNKAGI